jgi:outer membrane protein assembly factor BamB
VAWKDTLVIDELNTGDFGDGVAVDALAQIFFSKVTPEGELVILHRSSDGASSGTTLVPGEGRDRAESLALAGDGSALYVATAGAVLAVDPSPGELLWEHPAGAVLVFHDVLADPEGGVLARGVAGFSNGVVALDADGGPRFNFTDDAMLTKDHAGWARDADGEIILAFNVFLADPPPRLRVRKHAANNGEIVWQRLHDRDAGLVISAAVVAGDGAIYLAGEESVSGIAENMVTLYRLDADGALEWAVAVGENPRLFGEAAQGLVALVDGDVLIAPTELPQVLRFDAAGELVGTIDVSDGMIDYTGMAMQQDPCGAVAFVHTGFLEVDPDTWQRALTVGRLWP